MLQAYKEHEGVSSGMRLRFQYHVELMATVSTKGRFPAKSLRVLDP